MAISGSPLMNEVSDEDGPRLARRYRDHCRRLEEKYHDSSAQVQYCPEWIRSKKSWSGVYKLHVARETKPPPFHNMTNMQIIKVLWERYGLG